MSAKVKNKKIKPAPRARRGRTMSSRLSSKNQVTVPIDVCRKAGFTVGDQLVFKVRDDGKVILEKEVGGIERIFGLLNGVTDDFDWRKDRKESWGD